ncbi:TetR/AcrR family transcriptional regulator [Actinoplanes sp. TBRC 11911]|uniref:TetR/AcrR family transcriptional regulator n=1 Tax=Actinoplanes sp. TBRC 11911 TaxID=2729386 RepID=UPI00145C8FD7|nr:TetR/AcrR family transcriptional regulator [Actinoplanes sp. TBRC 11911]NMO54895.1 TetR/AcrR family transcriptional regulator [Actinoplanes sp. TBRC 11911]
MDDHTAVATKRGEKYGGLSRTERASERRARIVASAVHLFGTREYESITVAEVCTGAKVSKRYFYEHFHDREDLIVQVHRETNEWLLTGVVRSAPEHPASIEELLRPALRTLVRMLRDQPERARVIYINAPRMETRRRGVLRHDAEFLAHVLRRVSTGPEDQVRYGRTLLALVAGISEVIIDWITNGMDDPPDLLADHLTGIALALLNN